jgi:hypothetical protein
MKIVGFTGGSSLCELGPATDVQLFFDCLNFYVASNHPEQDWELLTDRLYKRYLRLDELDKALVLMAQAKQIFTILPSQSIDWPDVKKTTIQTRLDPSKKTLAEIFEGYFENFSHCVESAKINYEGFKSYPGYRYEPVRVIVSDVPWFTIEKNRSLEEYNMLEGVPFWAK